MSRIGTVVCVATLAGLLTSTAGAQPSRTDVGRAEELAETAAQLYRTGDYAGAVAAYRQAYESAPTPALLYNIAFIYDRQLDLPDVAAEYYRRCIESPDADPELMARATRRLTALREASGKRGLPPEGPAADGMDAQDTGGWISVGTGAAMVVTGLALGLVANQRQTEFEASRDLDEKRALRDEGRTLALTGDILVGVGLAGVVTGTVLLLVHPGREPRTAVTTTTGWRVGVDPLPSGAALSVGGGL